MGVFTHFENTHFRKEITKKLRFFFARLCNPNCVGNDAFPNTLLREAAEFLKRLGDCCLWANIPLKKTESFRIEFVQTVTANIFTVNYTSTFKLLKQSLHFLLTKLDLVKKVHFLFKLQTKVFLAFSNTVIIGMEVDFVLF